MGNLSDLGLFLAVAETLSFAEAARRLGLSPSATGKGIARFEARLGVRLFHRTTRRVSLTAEGLMVWERGRRIREDWQDVEVALAQAASVPRGRLRISLPVIGYRFLVPHLPAFARAYPEVRLDLDLDDRIVDIVGEGMDAAIRSGVLPDSTLMSRKLGGFRFLLCAAPHYLADRGKPDTMASLAQHDLVRFRHPGTETLQAWRLRTPLPAEVLRGPPALVCTHMEAVLTAVAAGLGIGFLPDFLAAEALRRGDIVSILDDETGLGGDFWLLWPASRQFSPKLRAFADFAARALLRN